MISWTSKIFNIGGIIMLENLNENNIWEKRFSVGIAIETTLSDFEGMLENYGRYIDNFYCSLPLGDKFHGRTHVANQFKNPENIQKFWEIAKMINKSDVGFEIVFNTDKLIEEDFYMCRNELEKHGITVDKIAILDKYYELVSAIFPNVKLVNSVNNMPNTLDGIRQISHKYDEIVIGRQFIRNIDAFHIVTEELGSDCVLLVNNGCSHICGGCRSFDYCNDCYEKEKKGLLQSISMHCKAFYLMKLVKNTLIQAQLNCLNLVQEMQIRNSFANVSIVTFMIMGKNM